MYNAYGQGPVPGMNVGVGGLPVGMDALESYMAMQNQVQDAMAAVNVVGQGTGGNMSNSGGALLEQQMRLNQLQQLQQLQNQIFQQQVRKSVPPHSTGPFDPSLHHTSPSDHCS